MTFSKLASGITFVNRFLSNASSAVNFFPANKTSLACKKELENKFIRTIMKFLKVHIWYSTWHFNYNFSIRIVSCLMSFPHERQYMRETLTLSCIMWQNGVTYIKYLAVFTPQDFKVCLAISQHYAWKCITEKHIQTIMICHSSN